MAEVITSLHPRLLQSSERSSGRSWPARNASKEVNFRPRFSSRRETRERRDSPWRAR